MRAAFFFTPMFCHHGIMRSLTCLVLTVTLCVNAQTAEQSAKANKARALMEAGNFAQAAALYGELNQAIPNNAGLLLNQGMALHMAGEDAKAVPVLQSALKLNPSIPPALLFLGASFLRTGRPAEAIAPLEKFIALDPNHLESRLMIVDACTSAGQNRRALPHLEKLTQLDPKRPGAWYELGRGYENAAFEGFAELEKVFPESGPFFALLAESRSKANQKRAAFYFYRQALAKSPGLRGMRTGIAEIYKQNGNADWAAKELAAEAKLGKPICSAAAPKTPECEFAAGRYAAAIQLTRVRPTAVTAEQLYWRVRSYDMLARQAFAKLTALPESPESFRLIAETHREQGRHAESVAAWREVLRLAPGRPDYQRELAAELMEAKQYAEAQALLDTLLKAEPGAPDLLHLQGDLYLAQQLPEQAVPFLEKAVKADPNGLPSRASLARALLAAGKPAEALPHVTAALPLDGDGSLHFQLARAYQAAGQTDAAAAAMKKYQEIKSRARQQDRFVEEELKITPP